MRIEYIEKEKGTSGIGYIDEENMLGSVGIKWQVDDEMYGVWRHSYLNNELNDFLFLAFHMLLWGIMQKLPVLNKVKSVSKRFSIIYPGNFSDILNRNTK